MGLNDFLINRLKKLKAELNGNITESFSANVLTSNSLVVNSSSLIAGSISGSLIFNTTTTPPIVTSGVFEAGGIPYQKTTDTTLALATHNFTNSITTFDTYQWYRVIINKNTGAFNYIHAFDTTSPAASGTITNISVAAGVATITCNSTTGIVTAENQVAVISVTVLGSGTMTNLVGRATFIDGTHFSVPTSYLGASPGDVTATFATYYRIQKLHGGSGSITADPDVEKYTPAMLNGFVKDLNGYYLDINGIETTVAANSVYRVLGIFYVHTGPIVRNVISYKSGKNKNDNYAWFMGLHATQYGATDTKVIRLLLTTTGTKMWGNDWTLSDSAANATKFQINTPGDVSMSGSFRNSAGSVVPMGISINAATPVTSDISALNNSTVLDSMINNNNETLKASISDIPVINGDILRFHSNGGAISAVELAITEFRLKI